MIVYSDREELVNTQAFLRRIRQAADPQERLILEGQYEAAVADAICTDFDDEVDLCRVRPPEQLRIKRPEGYAFYSLYPEAFEEAALQFLREQAPRECVVVGIRSIGTSLSRVVAQTVHSVFRVTVRPRGHPFEREVRLAPGLERRLRDLAARAWFLIVDEGPGLSGSSFISVAGKLEELGVPADRMVLFPSHEPNPDAFVSERARQNWRRFRRYVVDFQPERFVPTGARDISGGQWREILYSDEGDYPAVQPQHERRKYLHEGQLWKFEGLAHFGRAKLVRALLLKDFCPPALSFHNGFLATRWVSARPARLSDALLDTMARYLVFLRSEFATGGTVPGEALEEMIERNTGQRVEAPQEGVTVAVDGRMLPHEWLESEDGFRKADALDHHDDHFFPGCQDIAWDIAGASVEWGFPMAALADRYLRRCEEPTLRARLPFYETAYKAYRFGYCHMAAETLSDAADGHRFRLLLERYRCVPSTF